MYDFDSISEPKRYLRQAGLQQDAEFVGLTYEFTDLWEAFDIEFKCVDGSTFRERTFGPNIDKVYPKPIYESGKNVGMETQKQAYDRVNKEIAAKLFHLACCFTTPAEVKDSVKASDLKSLVDGMNKVINRNKTGEEKISFLTIWKNNDTKQKSNLIIADRIKWCEPTIHNADGSIKPSTLTLTKNHLTNGMVEKYPYNSSNTSTEPFVGEEKKVDNGLPF